MASPKSYLSSLETAVKKLEHPKVTKGQIKEPFLLLLQLFYTYVIFFNSIFFSILKYFLLFGQKPVKDKIVLITGSGRGLGRELSLEFAKLGSKIICVDIDYDSNEETVNTLNHLYPSCVAKGYVANIGKKEDVIRIVEEIENDFGRVDILISNAALTSGGSILDIDDIEFESIININLISQFRLIRKFLPGMLKRDDGHIVVISDVLSLTAIQNGAAYTASKWGVNGLMESLYEELRKIPDHKVKISCACPYFVNTSATYTKAWKIRIPELPLSVAAKSVVVGIRRNERLFTVPRFAYFYYILLKLLPDNLSNRIKDIFYMEFNKSELTQSSQ